MTVDEIRHGGMATVYLASDRSTGMEMAIKSFDPDLGSAFLRRFEEEAAIWAALPPCPFIVRVHAFTRRRHPQIAVERLSGGNLREFLRAGTPHPEQNIRLITQIAAGLAFLHEQGVIHGDLKPENVLLTDEGDAKITDFGLAQMVSRNGTRVRGGSPPYMAPELVRGAPASEASDCYALGLIYHELVRGLRPSQAVALGDAARESNPDNTLQSLFLRALAPLPYERPSVDEMASVLSKVSGISVRTGPDVKVSSYANRGATLSRLGRHDEAIALLEASLSAGEEPLVGDPPSDVVRVNLATALRRAGNPNRAAGIAGEALSRSPDDMNALLTVVTCHFELGELTEGEKALARLHELYPDHSYVLLVRLQWALGKGDVDLVREVAEAGAQALAGDADALNGWAYHLVEFEQPELAIPIFEMGRRLYPSDERWLINLAILRERHRGLEQAHDGYLAAARATPDSSFVQFLLARSLLRQGDYGNALGAARRCHRLAPKASYTGAIMPLAEAAAKLEVGSEPAWITATLQQVFDSSFVRLRV